MTAPTMSKAIWLLIQDVIARKGICVIIPEAMKLAPDVAIYNLLVDPATGNYLLTADGDNPFASKSHTVSDL